MVRVTACIAALVLAAASVGPAGARIIGNFEVTPFSFSPNGDGVSDTLAVSYALTDSATSVWMFVLDKNLVTIIDTLVSGTPDTAGASVSLGWDGRRFDGSPVPEDSFVVSLQVTNDGGSETETRNVRVDVTAPTAMITNIVPPDLAPNIRDSFQTIFFTVSDPPPSELIITKVDILSPNGAVFATLADTSLTSGPYDVTWSPSGTADGIHQARIVVRDEASNQSATFQSINIDAQAPTVSFTKPSSGGSFRVPPDSLSGFARDRNHIQGLDIEFPDAGNFVPLVPTRVQGDTSFFKVALAENLKSQGESIFRVRARDPFGRTTTETFSVTWDTTPPPSPVLEEPASPTRMPFTRITASSFSSDLGDRMILWRNGTAVDSFATDITNEEPFPVEVALVPGTNRIWAISTDLAGNQSDISNTIVVVLDNTVGFFIEQPFRPDNVFQFNFEIPPRAVTIRIYDLGGDLVEVLRADETGTNVTVRWNGLNGDGEDVKKGPLVAVVAIVYPNGDKDVLREIFLFEPGS